MVRVLAVLAALAPLAAAAHGDAEWIRQGGYLDGDGNRCCGPQDCHPAPPGAILRTADGWTTPATGRRWRRGEAGLYQSEDFSPWWCVREGVIYCIFVPPEAT